MTTTASTGPRSPRIWRQNDHLLSSMWTTHHPLERLEAIAAACLNGIFAAMSWLTHA